MDKNLPALLLRNQLECLAAAEGHVGCLKLFEGIDPREFKGYEHYIGRCTKTRAGSGATCKEWMLNFTCALYDGTGPKRNFLWDAKVQGEMRNPMRTSCCSSLEGLDPVHIPYILN